MTIFSIVEQVLVNTTAILRLVRARPGSIWMKHSCYCQMRRLSVSKGWRMRLVQFLTDADQNGVRVGVEEKDGGNVTDLNLFDGSLPQNHEEFLEKGEIAMETARRLIYLVRWSIFLWRVARTWEEVEVDYLRWSCCVEKQLTDCILTLKHGL